MRKAFILLLFVLNLSCMRNTWDEHTFMYVVNDLDNTISRYNIDPYGTVMHKETVALPAAGAVGSMYLRIHPNGKFVYVQLTGSYAVYTAEDDGTLTSPRLYANITRGTYSFGIYLDDTHFFSPDGRWHTSINGADTTVFFDSVDQDTGMLTQLSSTGTGNWPGCPIFHTSGKYFYVFSVSGNGYYVYSVSDTGTVTSGAAWVGWATNPPERMVIHPSGKFIYGTDNISQIWMIPVISDGADINYPNVIRYPVTSSTNRGTYLHPGGKFVYAMNSNYIDGFSIDQTTGQLTSIGTYTLSTTPYMAAFNPSGKWLYVSHTTTSTITVLNVDETTGAISLNCEIPTGSTPRYIGVANVCNEDR